MGNAPNDPKQNFNTNRSKVLCIHHILTPKAQILVHTEHFAVKSTLYTLNTYPEGPNFGLFRSTTSVFQDTRSSKVGNGPKKITPN